MQQPQPQMPLLATATNYTGAMAQPPAIGFKPDLFSSVPTDPAPPYPLAQPSAPPPQQGSSFEPPEGIPLPSYEEAMNKKF